MKYFLLFCPTFYCNSFFFWMCQANTVVRKAYAILQNIICNRFQSLVLFVRYTHCQDLWYNPVFGLYMSPSTLVPVSSVQ